jgi:hypothetical protein
MTVRLARVLLLVPLVAACRAESAPPDVVAGRDNWTVTSLPTPAQPRSGEPNLAPLPDGRVLLSWIEQVGDDRHALRFATRAAGGEWSAPATIAEGSRWFVNWADFPAVGALADGTLYANWLEKHADAGQYAYDVRVTRSTDGGATWSAPVTAHDDGRAAEHGFVSMAAASAGGLGFAWLDGREMTGHHGGGEHGGAMTLRFALFDRDGAKRDETVVDPKVCDCCQTALVASGDSMVLAYRDRSDDEIRDVVVRRRVGGRWSEPIQVGAERWKIAGCPVNGPALAASGDDVALAWFTQEGEGMRAKAALSRDGGATWGPPVVIDEGKPLGRVDVAAIDGGGALVSWLEGGEGSAATLRVRALRATGDAGPLLVVADLTGARASGFPRLERQGEEVVVAWTDPADPPRVHTAVLR